MAAVVLDTTVYVSEIRSSRRTQTRSRSRELGATVWLSAVVLAELYSGAGGKEIRLIEELESDYTRIQRILTPNSNDWIAAGRLLARLSTEFDFEEVGKAYLMNDALLAMSAARQGITVVTHNGRDFERMAALKPFSWRLADSN